MIDHVKQYLFAILGAGALIVAQTTLGAHTSLPVREVAQSAPRAQTQAKNSLDGFTSAGKPYAFSFPRDHGKHPDYRTEWWYFTGHLESGDGHAYGYELTFFRVGLRPGNRAQPADRTSRWRTSDAYPAHFAISDLGAKKFYADERFERGALDIAGASTTGLDVHVGAWQAKMGADGSIALHAKAADRAIDLQLRPEKPPAIHGRDGVSKKGACESCASHYYSYTRLATKGTIAVGGAQRSVSGASWMDHEFASGQLGAGEVGWDWFAIMLADGREIMIYRMRRSDGTIDAYSSGSIIARDGSVERLDRDAVTVQSNGQWKSPATDAKYPNTWHVRIPRKNIDLTITPFLADQELGAAGVTPAYWEGASDVVDAAGTHVGRAYVELSGYAAPLDVYKPD